MSFDVAYRLHQDAPPSDLRELDVVALTAAVESDDGETLSSGSEGTIVSIYHQGGVYVVEFPTPAGALATVQSDKLRLVSRTSA